MEHVVAVDKSMDILVAVTTGAANKLAADFGFPVLKASGKTRVAALVVCHTGPAETAVFRSRCFRNDELRNSAGMEFTVNELIAFLPAGEPVEYHTARQYVERYVAERLQDYIERVEFTFGEPKREYNLIRTELATLVAQPEFTSRRVADLLERLQKLETEVDLLKPLVDVLTDAKTTGGVVEALRRMVVAVPETTARYTRQFVQYHKWNNNYGGLRGQLGMFEADGWVAALEHLESVTHVLDRAKRYL